MFIDFDQIILLLVLAFILFGPEKLPEYAHKLGRFMAKMREASAEISQQCSDLTKPLNQPLAGPASPAPAAGPVCPQCQQAVGADFSFCPKCGRRLQELPSGLAS